MSILGVDNLTSFIIYVVREVSNPRQIFFSSFLGIQTNDVILYNKNMIELHSEDWFVIKGRGNVAVIENAWTLSGDEYSPESLTGKTVKIDNTEYKVLGVEMFMIGCSEQNPYRLKYSLLVE